MASTSASESSRKCLLSDTERDELADILAKRVVDVFFARISAAADQEENERVQAIGRWVDGVWRKWRWRILFPVGGLGLALVAGIHFSKKEIVEFFLKLLAGM